MPYANSSSQPPGMGRMPPFLGNPPAVDDKSGFEPLIRHGHLDLVQATAFNSYGDRCATGGVDGKIRVFNRHKEGQWRLCDSWSAHGGEILEVDLDPSPPPHLLPPSDSSSLAHPV